MKGLRIKKKEIRFDGAETRNWTVAKDYFPEIEVNQKTGTVHVRYFESENTYGNKANINTDWIEHETKGDSAFVRGEVSCKNWKHWECSGTQKFCFAIFQGDSGHIYTHRAPATKGWMNAKPAEIRKRLRKLGIGVEEPAYQQGDFLLKKANGQAPEETEFRHETMGAGHHKFVAPVLYCDKDGKRFYNVTETITMIHHAVDGIQHPDITIEPGTYVVGTTASSLHHSNKRD